MEDVGRWIPARAMSTCGWEDCGNRRSWLLLDRSYMRTPFSKVTAINCGNESGAIRMRRFFENSFQHSFFEIEKK